MDSFYSAFLTSKSALQYSLTFMQTFTCSHTDGGERRQPARREHSGGGTLAQGHLDTQTSNLPVTSRPALPPEPHAALCERLFEHSSIFECSTESSALCPAVSFSGGAKRRRGGGRVRVSDRVQPGSGLLQWLLNCRAMPLLGSAERNLHRNPTVLHTHTNTHTQH